MVELKLVECSCQVRIRVLVRQTAYTCVRDDPLESLLILCTAHLLKVALGVRVRVAKPLRIGLHTIDLQSILCF